jgi:hypothetical protein
MASQSHKIKGEETRASMLRSLTGSVYQLEMTHESNGGVGGNRIVRGNRSTVDPRTSNGLMLEQLETRTKQFEENPILKLEQKLESRTKNHVVVTWSPSLSLSLLERTRSCSVSFPVTGSVSIPKIQSVLSVFCYLFGLFLYYL